MKAPFLNRFRSGLKTPSKQLTLILVTFCTVALAEKLSAANLAWDSSLTPLTPSGGIGTWDLATSNWSNGASNVAWPNVTANDDKAIFGATAGTVTLGSSLTAGGIQFDTSGYTVSGALDLTLSPQTTGSDALLVSSGVSNISIGLRKLILTASGSTAIGDLVNTDKVNFGNTIVAISGSRQLTLSNSTAGGTTTFGNFAVGSGSPGGASLFLNQGNLTITNFSASTSTSALAAANSTSTTAGIAFRGTGSGKLTLSGNNTLLNNAGSGTLGINFLNANATYEIGHDNALGARDAGAVLTDTFIEFNAGTLTAINGAREIANSINHTGSFAISGSNPLTLSGSYTQSGGNRTLTINNVALTRLSGPVFLANDNATARTLTIGGTGNTTISGSIANNKSGNTLASSLTKSGTGLLTLGGTNTYTGNTTVNSGASLILASGGSLKFAIGAAGVSNKVTGAGSVTLDGAFNIDVTGAGTPSSGSVWTLVETKKTFGTSFTVDGFTETSSNSGLWVNGSWYFSELSGKLSYGTPPDQFWDGDSGGAWSVGGNWTSGNAPISGDNLVFSGTNTINNNDLNTATQGNIQLGGIIFGPGASSFNLVGNAANLSGKTITNYSSSPQAISFDIEADNGFSVDTSAGSITVTGSLKTTSGFNKPITKNGSGILVLNGTQNTSWNLQVNAGTLQVFNPNTANQVTAFSCTIAAGAKLIGESGDILHSGLGLQNNGTFDISASGEAFGNLNGSGLVINHGSSPEVTCPLELGRGNSSFAGSIQDGPSGSPTAVRIFEGYPADVTDYTHTFSGVNTYTGNTTLAQGDQSFSLTSTGSLKFKIGANGINNQIAGEAQTLGTVTLNGTFNFDLTGAAIANGNTWQIVSAALLPTTTFGSTFNVAGFTEASNVWTKLDGPNTWTFTEDTGVLSLASGGNYSNWASANGISGEDPTGDFDGDGLSNLVEYALGKNPKTSSSPAGTSAAGVITFTKGADAIANGDVSWVIEESTNLSSWIPVVTQSAGNASPTISHPIPSGQPRVFHRLKIAK